MTRDPQALQRDTELVLRTLDEAVQSALSQWRDEIAADFYREFVDPLRDALKDFERALRDAAEAVDELDRFD